MQEDRIDYAARVSLILKAGKRSATIGGMTIEDVRLLKFKTICALKDAFQEGSGDDEAIRLIFEDQGRKVPGNLHEIDKAKFILYLHDGLRGIANMEAESFQGMPSDGVDTSGLDKFKELNVIDQIAGGDSLKWEAIENLPYMTVFLKQLKTFEETKIELARIKSQSV